MSQTRSSSLQIGDVRFCRDFDFCFLPRAHRLRIPIQRHSAHLLGLVMLCPPPLQSLAFDAEVGTNCFYAPSTVTALMNAGFYAAIRALLLRRLERPD